VRSVDEVSVGLFTKRLPTPFRVWLENEEHPVEASSWCGSREVRWALRTFNHRHRMCVPEARTPVRAGVRSDLVDESSRED